MPFFAGASGGFGKEKQSLGELRGSPFPHVWFTGRMQGNSASWDHCATKGGNDPQRGGVYLQVRKYG